MAKQRGMNDEVARVEIRDWPGLVTHADRQDIPPGAGRLQVNMQSDRQGALRVRRGLTLVQFDARGLVELSDIVSVQESVTAFLEFVFRTTEDSVTVTENVNAAQGFNAATSDTITVTETINAAQGFNANVITDSVTLSEAIEANLVIRFASTSDSVTLTESVTVLKTLLREVSDTVTVSENLYTVQPDIVWSGNEADKFYLTSGTFSSTLKTSQSVANYATVLRGPSWDGTNTPYCGFRDVQNQYKLSLVSGLFSSTVKTSSTVEVTQSTNGISWDGTDTPWCGSGASSIDKLFLRSGQFSSTTKTSLSIESVDSNSSGISWDGTDTPWTGRTDDKLYLQSGQFSSTVKSSLDVSAVSTNPFGISWNGTDTPWLGTKLMLQSGQFSSTIRNSQAIASIDNSPHGIDVRQVELRI